MIKYLGSKRTLIPVLGEIASTSGATSAVDLFTGTTRVAQEFKRRGLHVIANDIATYSEVMAQCYIQTDAQRIDMKELRGAISELNELPGDPGYFTRTFCEQSRFFQPKNGARIDAIRNRIEESYSESWMRPILLTSLMLAADRVDSTTGVQMAYLKQWAARSYNDLELRIPDLVSGSGEAVRKDAYDFVSSMDQAEMIYLDPPYNQHRYFTNYHIWETLMRWDSPEPYGVACKRIDSRDDTTKSPYNMKRKMPNEINRLIHSLKADLAVVSYNNESWIDAEDMMMMLRESGFADVRLLAFDYKRYVGAQIGIFNPSGHKVGKVSHLRNVEYIFLAGDTHVVSECASQVEHLTLQSAQQKAASNRLF